MGNALIAVPSRNYARFVRVFFMPEIDGTLYVRRDVELKKQEKKRSFYNYFCFLISIKSGITF